MRARSRVFAVLLLLANLASAQTVTSRKAAPAEVFSDRPVPGSKPVDLKPLNVVEPVPVPLPGAVAAPVPADERRAPAVLRYKVLCHHFAGAER